MKAKPFLFITYFIFLFSFEFFAQENCANALDDDGDGLIDLNDVNDCSCDDSGVLTNIIPNPSFENMNCCPYKFDQLDCATSWYNPNGATPDYYNTCGYQPPFDDPSLDDGQGYAGIVDGTEYIASCLLSPMKAGTTYSLKLDLASAYAKMIAADGTTYPCTNVNVSIFGYSTCVSFPTSLTNCIPSTGWIELGSVADSPYKVWHTATITFTPSVDIHSVMIGSSCTKSCDMAYVYIDNLKLKQFPPKMTIDSTGSICSNDLVLTAHPGYKNGLYQWYKNGIALVGQTDSILNVSRNNFGEGKFTFKNLQSAGALECITISKTVKKLLVLSIKATPIRGCGPLNSAFSSLSNVSGTCSWDFGDGFSDINCSASHIYSKAGTYDVRFKFLSTGGCPIDSLMPKLITVYPLPVVNFMTDKTFGCAPLAVNFTNISTSLGTCSWSFGDGHTSSQCENTYNAYAPGKYNVSLTLTSDQGCSSTLIKNDIVKVFPKPHADFNFSSNYLNLQNTEISFSDKSVSNIKSWLWNFANLGASAIQNPVYIFPDLKSGNYPVTLVVTNSDNCTDTIVKKFTISKLSTLFIPNSFSPNNDGINDELSIYYNNISTFHLMVFNRWGELIFESNDPSKTWDGTYREVPVQMDVYVYIVDWSAVEGEVINHHANIGRITLIR